MGSHPVAARICLHGSKDRRGSPRSASRCSSRSPGRGKARGSSRSRAPTPAWCTWSCPGRQRAAHTGGSHRQEKILLNGPLTCSLELVILKLHSDYLITREICSALHLIIASDRKHFARFHSAVVQLTRDATKTEARGTICMNEGSKLYARDGLYLNIRPVRENVISDVTFELYLT
eukprot:137413-Pyramimonas_sp.AAC.2